MIPSILSQQINQGLQNFLSTTFYSTIPFFHGMLDRFLNQDGSLSKGPYISLQLPFQKGSSHEFFSEIPLGFTPHLHQELAFARLSGPNPLPSIIASGTGSGKTECFSQPILEHCRTSDQPGIKAIKCWTTSWSGPGTPGCGLKTHQKPFGLWLWTSCIYLTEPRERTWPVCCAG